MNCLEAIKNCQKFNIKSWAYPKSLIDNKIIDKFF